MFFLLTPYQQAISEENFILINGKSNEVITELGPCIHERISPCSTFKIPLSLMGYDAEILKDVMYPIWNFRDGYDDYLEFWKSHQTPLSWMQYSCVWYSKILSIKLGLSKIQNYLVLMEYGNQSLPEKLVDPGSLNPFWINSSLKISAKEQVAFLQKMLLGQLPVSFHAVQMTREILFKEELSDGWKLFGKTGWSGSDITKDGKTLEHSWFVGWIEKNLSFYPFAYVIYDKKIQLEQRIPRVKELIIQSYIMQEALNE